MRKQNYQNSVKPTDYLAGMGDTCPASTESKRKDIPSTLSKEGFTRIMPMAGYIGVNHQTIRRWYKNGKFPKPKMLNGVLLFSNAEVLAHLKQQSTAQG